MDNKEKRSAECECGRVLSSNGITSHLKRPCHHKAMEEKGTTKEIKKKIQTYLKQGKGSEINEMINKWERDHKK